MHSAFCRTAEEGELTCCSSHDTTTWSWCHKKVWREGDSGYYSNTVRMTLTFSVPLSSTNHLFNNSMASPLEVELR